MSPEGGGNSPGFLQRSLARRDYSTPFTLPLAKRYNAAMKRMKSKSSKVAPSPHLAPVELRGDIFPPKYDFMFKLVFGDKNCLDPLVAILQAILPWLPKDEFEGVTILEGQQKRLHQDGKQCVLDLCVRLTSGRMVNIEIQLLAMAGILNRMQFYNARMMVEQTKKGQPYKEIAQVVTILILEHEMFADGEYHHEYRLVCRKTGLEFPGSQEVHVLELPKLSKENDGTDLWRWLRFLVTETYKEMRTLAKGDKVMAQAAAKVKQVSATQWKRHLAFRRDLEVRDQKARIQYGEEKGRAEERADVALRMLQMKMPLTDIVTVSGLSEADVKRLAAGKKTLTTT